MKSICRITVLAMAGGSLAMSSSCSTGGRSPSGFPANYQQLDAGYGTADAVSACVKPGADFKKYDSVNIHPVTMVVSAPGVSAAVQEQLAAYPNDSLRSQVVGGLKITNIPGPRTLMVRTALTDMVDGRDAGAPVTTRAHGPACQAFGKPGVGSGRRFHLTRFV